MPYAVSRRSRWAGAFASVATAALVGSYGVAVAQEPVITVTPIFREVQVEPGQSSRARVLLKNQTSEDINVTPRFSSLTLSHRDGSRETVPSSRDGHEWLRANADQLHIRSATEAWLDFNVDVPASAAAGGYYASLLLEAEQEKPSGTVQIRAAIEVVVLVTVGRPPKEPVQITMEKDLPVALFGSSTFTIVLRNTGTVHRWIEPQLIGDGVFSDRRTVSLGRVLVLPESTRKFRVPLHLETRVDVIRTRARYEGGESSKRLWFVVLPWQVLALIALATLLIQRRLRGSRSARLTVMRRDGGRHGRPPS